MSREKLFTCKITEQEHRLLEYIARRHRCSQAETVRNLIYLEAIRLDEQIESLSPNDKKVYLCIVDSGEHGMAPQQIAEKFNLSSGVIAGSIRKLREINLIDREECYDPNGLYSVYRSTKTDKDD